MSPSGLMPYNGWQRSRCIMAHPGLNWGRAFASVYVSSQKLKKIGQWCDRVQGGKTGIGDRLPIDIHILSFSIFNKRAP